MNMLASLKNPEGVKIAEDKDSLGGMHVFDSGAITFTIGMAYTSKSEGGALGLHVTYIGPDKKEFRNSQWMTSGNDKGNKTYYTKDNVNYPLPGFSIGNALAMLTVGKEIADLETETKVIKLYNAEAKGEVPTEVQAIVELIGKEIVIGIVKEIVDKTKKGDDNKYHPTGETREQNDIDKLFCARESHLHMTLAEIKAGATEAGFYEGWVAKNTGVVRNKASKSTGTAGAPAAAGATGTAGTAKPKTSLFN